MAEMNLKSPQISVVMTVYNTVDYLSDAIDAVLTQTFTSLELIIVDDGSTLANQTAIKALISQKNDPRIVYGFKPHIGRSKALNEGLAMAQGEWISILDADDLWPLHKLQLQWDLVHEHEISFISGVGVAFQNGEEVQALYGPTSSRITPISTAVMLLENRISHGAILAKKSLMHYNETLTSQVDYDLWMRLIEQGETLYAHPNPVLFHRIHPRQSFEGRRIFRYRFNFLKRRLVYAKRLNQFHFIPIILAHFVIGLCVNRRRFQWLLTKLSSR